MQISSERLKYTVLEGRAATTDIESPQTREQHLNKYRSLKLMVSPLSFLKTKKLGGC